MRIAEIIGGRKRRTMRGGSGLVQVERKGL